MDDGALRDTRHNRGPVRFNTIYYYPLLPEAHYTTQKFQRGPSNLAGIGIVYCNGTVFEIFYITLKTCKP